MIIQHVNLMQLQIPYKIKSYILISLILSSCHEYNDGMYERKEPLTHSTAYYNSVPEWKLLDNNNQSINGKLDYFDTQGKILKVEITINSKKEHQNGTVLLWYGGDSNIYNGETPLSIQPQSLIKMINLAKVNTKYKILPPQNNEYKAWAINSYPIELSNKSNSSLINNSKPLNINLYLYPETTLDIIKKDVYVINPDNSFVERKKIKYYGIFGSISDVIRFSQIETYRRIFINAKSIINNSEINIDSDFVLVKTER